MNITYAASYEQMSNIGADLFCRTLIKNPEAVVCFATGTSPKGMYRRIAERCRTQGISTQAMTCIKLDEWHRLPMDHRATCEHYLQQELAGPLGLRSDQLISFDSDTEDPAQECRRIEELLRDRPLDLCILGLGANGHLGLNEPGSYMDLRTHTVELAESSRHHSMLEGVSVSTGMTLGLGEIFSAQKILFLVTGENKEAAFEALLSERISTDCPASLLWLHRDVQCIVDQQSLG
jgi:galactosamine-6-phosphate isomerase